MSGGIGYKKRIIGHEILGVNSIMTGGGDSRTYSGDNFWQNRNGWRNR